MESGNEGDQSIGGVGNIGVNETIGMNRIVNGPTPNGDTKLVSCFEKNPTLYQYQSADCFDLQTGTESE